MRVNFILRTPNKPQTAVIATLTYNAQRVKVGTGITVTAAAFDAKTQRLKKNTPQSVEVNQALTNFTNFCADAYRRYKNDNQNQPPPPNWLKSEINTYLNGGKPAKNTSPDLYGFIEKYITTRTDVSKSQRNKYAITYKHLKDFFAQSLIKPAFTSINLDVCLNFERYLAAPPLSFAPNTLGLYVRNFKHFLSEAYQRGYFDTYPQISGKIKAKSAKIEKIYLTQTEIDKIAALDLSDKPALNNARKWFLLGYYTGLRHSDFSTITAANVTDNMIKIT